MADKKSTPAKKSAASKQSTTKAQVTKKENIEPVMAIKKLPKYRNLWFWLFILLLIAILTSTALLFGLITRPNNNTNKILNQQQISSSTTGNKPATFDINLNKKQINDLISNYIKENNFSDDLTAGIKDDHLVIVGKFKLLGKRIDFTGNFNITSSSDGNIELTLTKATAGSIEIPNQPAMTMFNQLFKSPNWLQIKAIDSKAVININQIDPGLQVKFKADSIDLANDRIKFIGSVK